MPPEGTAHPVLVGVDGIVARVAADPAALLSDDVLVAAVALDQVAIERLRQRLRAAGVRLSDVQAFVRVVKARRPTPAKVERAPKFDDRPRIVVVPDEDEVNDQASEALSRIPGLYSRMGHLARIAESKQRRPGEPEPFTTTVIRVVTEPLLRGYFSRAAVFVDMETSEPAHPPDWSVRNVSDRGDWPSVPPLYYLAESPLLLHDGRVLQRSGYDEATGIYCNTKIEVEVPDVLAAKDAKDAAAVLLDLVCDVPFENDASRSAWLASLITPIARWAFRGQCPLFMFDTNRPGVGKGLLVGLNSGIVLGRPCDLTVQTGDEEEERKRITSKVMAGCPIVLIDEVDKPFGSGPMQGLLTTGVWSDRLLGGNDAPSQVVHTVWYAAGVNIQFKSSDILRRVAVIRIVTEEEKPEERVGFKYDLESYVPEHRSDLFCAALVMLRAWLSTNANPAELPGWGGTWGGFNDWDRVVRGAIVFAGLADPILAKANRVAMTIKEGLADLVLGLEEALWKVGAGEATTAAVHEAMVGNDNDRKDTRGFAGAPPAKNFDMLRNGIHSLMPQLKGYTPSTGQLGTLIGRSKDQGVPALGTEDRKWIRGRTLHGKELWRVDVVPKRAAVPERSAADDDVERLEREAMEAGA